MTRSNDDLLRRLLGTATLMEVGDAYSCMHPMRPEYRWVAEVEIHGETIKAIGQIFHDETTIGRFERHLRYQRGHTEAFHDIMELEEEHRGKRIAFYHYQRAFGFYKRHGFNIVHLNAEGFGPVVWPQMGFDFVRRQHKEMLLKIMRAEGFDPLPAPTELFAPEVAVSERQGRLIGLVALKTLAKRADEPLPMRLDLQDDRVGSFLRQRGIIGED